MAQEQTVTHFQESIGAAPPALVYLFCPAKSAGSKGPTFEPFLAEQAVQRFLSHYLEPDLRDLAFACYYADETSPREIVLEAQSVPFLTERRYILVRGAEHYNNEGDDGVVMHYLRNPVDSTVMLLVASRVDRRTKFFKTCEKNGAVVACPELSPHEAVQWARNQASEKGKSLDVKAAQALIDRAGTHLSDVNNALNLVCNYVGEAAMVRPEDVAVACADVADEEIWALTDAIAGSQTEAALMAFHKLSQMGKHEDELMGIINWLLKSAYAVAVAGDRPARLSPFVAKKVKPLAVKLGTSKLRDAFALCVDTHYMLRSTGVDSRLAMELLVVKLASPRESKRPTPA